MNSEERDTRYRGHMSLAEIGPEGQRRLSEARVLIAGAGGLGSPVALYLAAAGVGHITVADPDTVSLSNLQRQIIHTTTDTGRPKALSAMEKMTAVNPLVTVEPLLEPITADNARSLAESHDVIADCTDNLATRLLISDTCVETGRPYVFGAVRRFGGQLFTHLPGTSSYRDIFDPSEAGGDTPCSVTGVLNTVVGVIGTLQATEVIKLITGFGRPLSDRLLTFDAITMTFNTFKLKP